MQNNNNENSLILSADWLNLITLMQTLAAGFISNSLADKNNPVLFWPKEDLCNSFISLISISEKVLQLLKYNLNYILSEEEKLRGLLPDACGRKALKTKIFVLQSKYLLSHCEAKPEVVM